MIKPTCARKEENLDEHVLGTNQIIELNYPHFHPCLSETFLK